MAEDKKPSGANFEQPVAVQLDEKVAPQRTTELATLFDNIPGLVAIMAADGAVEFTNERVREYFGRTLKQFKEWAISDVVHPHDLSYAVATWRGSTEAANRMTSISDSAVMTAFIAGFMLVDYQSEILRVASSAGTSCSLTFMNAKQQRRSSANAL